jgi:hypothetical protein
MQVSGGFSVPAERPWVVLVGAVVGDFLASDDAPWLAVVTRAAASSREAMPDRSVRKQPCVVVQRGRSRFVTQQARDSDDRRTFLNGRRCARIAQILWSDS